MANELKLPNSMAIGIYGAFHVSPLHLYKQGRAHMVPPPALLLSGGIKNEVEQILDHSDSLVILGITLSNGRMIQSQPGMMLHT